MLKQEYHFPPEILFAESKVNISLYQPLLRENVTVKQDMTRFKNLVGKLNDSLVQKYDKGEVERILKPLYALEGDMNFWNQSAKGLAILLNEDGGVVYRLNREVPELAIVADSFHIKPLLRNYQSIDHYYVIGLGKKNFKMFEGNRYYISELNLGDDVFTNAEDLLGTDVGGSQINVGGFGGQVAGYNTKSEEDKKDIEKFFRYVDKVVMDNISKGDPAPVILIGLTENQGEFRRISKNPFLLKKGINKQHEGLTTEAALEEIWTILEPIYLEKTSTLVERFNNARAYFAASIDISEIGKAAVEGRIGQLMVEAERVIPGKIDRETGDIISAQLENPAVDDLLDDIAEMVLSQRGEVVVLPRERMPSDTGVAAIFRY